MSKIIGIVIRKAAEGDFGALPKSIYWGLAGKKTLIGTVLLAAWGAVSYFSPEQCASCATWAEYLKWFAGFGISIGILDATLRLEPPQKA